jgi:hypothetical protein
MSIACPPNPKILRLSFVVAPSRRVGKRRRSTFRARWRTCRRLHRAKKAEYSTAKRVQARKWKSCTRRSREAKAQVGDQPLP